VVPVFLGEAGGGAAEAGGSVADWPGSGLARSGAGKGVHEKRLFENPGRKPTKG
jgi:hypothetical protein